MKKSYFIILSVLIIGLVTAGFAQQKDDVKCKDHPMFTRIPGGY